MYKIIIFSALGILLCLSGYIICLYSCILNIKKMIFYFIFLVLIAGATVSGIITDLPLLAGIPIYILIAFSNVYPLLKHKYTATIKLLKGNLVYYCQRDSRWGNKKFFDSNFAHKGCGPSVIAMVASVTNPDITPPDVSSWMNDYPWFNNYGMDTAAINTYFSQRNIACKAIKEKDIIISDLQNGAIFIVLRKKHYIIIAKNQRRTIVIDPARPNRHLFSNGLKLIDIIFKETDFTKTPYVFFGIYI